MNIFVVDMDPRLAAQALCDKHIVKMPLESAQMMATILRRHGATDEQMPLTKSGTIYKATHHNHPCTRWAGDSSSNFAWLANHATELAAEYTRRYGKTHACEEPILQMRKQAIFLLPTGPLTPFAQAMPEEYRISDDAVGSYREYYLNVKADIATWNKGRKPPKWWAL